MSAAHIAGEHIEMCEKTKFGVCSVVKYMNNTIDLVGEAISKCQNEGIISLTKAELKFVPLQYILNNTLPSDLNIIWDILPTKYKNNKELKTHLPCYVHYNRGRTQVDGPPPPIFKCHQCSNHDS